MKKLALVAALALALAGCSAGASIAPEAAPASPIAAQQVADTKPAPTPTPTKTADPSQAWADDMINLFLNGNSKSNFSEFNKSLPHHYIESWRTESKGNLSITVANGDWTTEQLDILGNTVMFTAGNETPGLRKVKVSTVDGSAIGYADRSNLQDF